MEAKNLSDNQDYIPAQEQTDRQSWAIGYLTEKFYNAGTLFNGSQNKDAKIETALSAQGFSADEIKPVAKHLKATFDWVNQQSPAVKQTIARNVIRQQGTHKPPAPKA